MNKVFLYSLIYLFGVIISSLSQVLLKKSANKNNHHFIKDYLNINVIIAYFIFIVATFCSIYSYKVIPITLGAILGTFEYIFVAILGNVIFKEKFNKYKIIGILLIITGVIIYSV
jgi:drug/metabolite transporter (DMT)-like permease